MSTHYLNNSTTENVTGQLNILQMMLYLQYNQLYMYIHYNLFLYNLLFPQFLLYPDFPILHSLSYQGF